MASSSRPCAASATGVLPLDAVYEILLRAPAKALCRMRAVSRPWRRLLSDPQFAATHAARRREPLFIQADFGFAPRSMDIIDLTGQTVKKVHLDQSASGLDISDDLVFLQNFGCSLTHVVNPATGRVHHLPSDDLAEGHTARGLHRRDYSESMIVGGQVASTREYKVLRLLSPRCDGVPHLCEVCSLGSSSHGDARWRGKQNPPGMFASPTPNNVIINGVVYLTSLTTYHSIICQKEIAEQDWIVPFDLDKEEWGLNIRGPQITFHEDDAEMSNDHSPSISMRLTSANLNSSLAVVHSPTPYIDIWILKDFQKGLWVKQYSLQVDGHIDPYYVNPLVVLDDGQIVIHIDGTSWLQSYDPRTNTSTNLVDRRCCSGISIYAGNLLSFGMTSTNDLGVGTGLSDSARKGFCSWSA